MEKHRWAVIEKSTGNVENVVIGTPDYGEKAPLQDTTVYVDLSLRVDGDTVASFDKWDGTNFTRLWAVLYGRRVVQVLQASTNYANELRITHPNAALIGLSIREDGRTVAIGDTWVGGAFTRKWAVVDDGRVTQIMVVNSDDESIHAFYASEALVNLSLRPDDHDVVRIGDTWDGNRFTGSVT